MSLENELKKNTLALIELTNAFAANEKGTVPASSPAPVQASPAASAPEDDGLVIPANETVADVLTPPTPPTPPAEVASEVIDKKQIIAAVIALAKAKGREPAKTVLAQFGAAKAAELNDAAQYPAVLAALTEAAK